MLFPGGGVGVGAAVPLGDRWGVPRGSDIRSRLLLLVGPAGVAPAGVLIGENWSQRDLSAERRDL